MSGASANIEMSPSSPAKKRMKKLDQVNPPGGDKSPQLCEDPGPGDVRVILSESHHEIHLNKRSFASKSEWFVHKLSFQNNKSEGEEEEEWVIELHPQVVSADALAVVEKFVNKEELSYRDEVAAEEVLVAANYLQMDALQAEVLEVVKKGINNVNCVNYYQDYVIGRGIGKLEAFIMSSIVRPSEAARRRKYGKTDLVIKLQQFPFPFNCHKTILASASKKIKGILDRDPSIGTIEGEQLGLTDQNVQLAYNLFEQIYRNEENFGSSSSKSSPLEELKLISILEMTDQYFQSILEDLCRQISVSNVGELYQAGTQLGQEDVVRIALSYLTFKIQDPRLESLFLALPPQHVSQVLASSRLNVPDELTVGKLALKWLEAQEKPWLDCKEVLLAVRWSRLSHLETETLLSSRPQLRQLLPQLTSQVGQLESRGWPQQLLLVASEGSHLSLHCYDLERKCWSVLASKHSPGWMKFSGATQINKDEDRLVFSHVNPDTPWNPFTVSTFYNVWGDSWSFPQEEQNPAKTKEDCQPQSLVAIKDEVFTVLAGRKQGRAVLYGASRVGSSSPLYSTYGPHGGSAEKYKTVPRLVLTGTKLNVIHDKTVSSYDTERHSWVHSSLAGNVLGSSWLSLPDGRLLRSGGISEQTGEASSQCVLLSGGLTGQPLTLGSLSQPRQGHHLAQLRGHYFAAGGSRTGRARKSEVEYYVPSTDIWHPLPVQPALSPGSSVLALMVINTPLRTLQPATNQGGGVKRSSETVSVNNPNKKSKYG